MNNYPSNVFIFDIDGVLVEPLGYRQAMFSALKWLFPQPELAALLPNENEHSLFESKQITSEWDMVAICSILIASKIIDANPALNFPPDLYQWRSLTYPAAPEALDYHSLIPEITGDLPTAENPSAAFYAYLTQDQIISHKYIDIDRLPPEILKNLLATRNIPQSPTSALFQNFSLGSQEFQSCYNIHPIVDSESLLLKCDRTLISPAEVNTLWHLYGQDRVQFAAMTARPSRNPPTALNPACSPPEAEMALKLVGLTGMPVIGLGSLEYAAESRLATFEDLIKPAPFHALSAILVALGFSQQDAIHAAAKITQNKQNNLARDIPDQLNVVIFEDTAVGIRSINRAARLLMALGKRVQVQNYGISQHPEKISSLEKIGAQIFSSIDGALQTAIHALL